MSNYTFEYQFKKFGITVSDIRVSIIVLPNGQDFILMKDTGRFNNLAKYSEEIASKLQVCLGVDPNKTIWGEYYQTHINRIDLVNYKWDGLKKRFINPSWTEAPNWLLQYILYYVDDNNNIKVNLN